MQTQQPQLSNQQLYQQLQAAQQHYLQLSNQVMANQQPTVDTHKTGVVQKLFWGMTGTGVIITAIAYFVPTEYLMTGIVLGGALLLLTREKPEKRAIDVDILQMQSPEQFQVCYVANPETVFNIHLQGIQRLPIADIPELEYKALELAAGLLGKGQPEVSRGKVEKGVYQSVLEVRSHKPTGKKGHYTHKDIALELIRAGLRMPDESQNVTTKYTDAMRKAKANGMGYWLHIGMATNTEVINHGTS